jgi:hypothetical protein
MDLREIIFNGVDWIQLAQDIAKMEAFYDDKDEPYDYIPTGIF